MKNSYFSATVFPIFLLCACSSSSEPSKLTDAGVVTEACPESKGPTVHQGDVAADEVWRAEDSPHLVRADVNVVSGAKLTIEPCAVVKVARDANVNVAFPSSPDRGALVAMGTAQKPIRFERLDDGPWGRVFVHHPGTAKLAWVTLEGGGGGTAEVGESLAFHGDAQLPSKHGLFVDHVTVKTSRGAGVKIDGGGAFDAASTMLTVTGSGDASSPYPIVMGELAVDSIPTGTYTGNARDELLIDPEVVSGAGGFLESTTMHDRGVPYRFGITPGTDNLYVGGSSATTASPTLTIEAGVTLKMVRDVMIEIDGSHGAPAVVRALGTKEKPVVITSAESTPKPGDWRGFYFNGQVSADDRLDHVRLEYTGADCRCSLVTCSPEVVTYDGALIFTAQPKSVFMKDSVIAHASGHAVVQGYDGASLDWKTSNTFDDVAGCIATVPRDETTWCPEAPPSCK